MWKLIDWSNKSETVRKDLHPSIIETFFKGIFQSPMIQQDPKIEDARIDIEAYRNYNEVTDKDLDVNELQLASRNMKRGFGIEYST